MSSVPGGPCTPIHWAAGRVGDPSGSRTLRDAINYAWGKDVVPVASAGNSGKEDSFYPAYYWNVIAAAATDHNDAKAKFSNYGGLVDVAAPGKSIVSTAPDHPLLEQRHQILRDGQLNIDA